MPLRVLVVAPKTDLLLVDSEVAAVVNFLRASLLNDHVTAEMLLDELAEQWDVVWFAAHGDESGVHLSDGPLGSGPLTSFIRTAGASLVVFNTCSSFQVANEIYNELLIDLVCTIRPVPDRDAFFTGKQFAIQLSRGQTPHEAYLLAKGGGNRDYVFMNKREKPVSPPVISPAQIDQLSEELRRLVEVMDGRPRDKVPGLLETVVNLSQVVAKMQDDFRFFRIAVWVIGAISLTMLLLSALRGI